MSAAHPKYMKQVVFIANLLFCFSLAIAAFSNSTFIQQAVHEKAVGFLYAGASLLTIFILSGAAKKMARVGNRMFYMLYATIHAAALAVLIMPAGPVLHTLAFITYLFSSYIIVFSLDVFFGSAVGHRNRGTARGLYLLLGNIGWVFAPIIGAFIIREFGFQGTYGIALGMFVIVTILLEVGLRKYRAEAHTPHHAHFSLWHVLKKKTLGSVVGANFILHFFYAWMVVYTPIYLSVHLGLPWEVIGILFSIMLTAFVILDYPLGRLADKFGSEKELAAIGFLIMTASVIGLAFLPPSVFTIGLCLFFSRVGAATVEAMTEIHFFKLAKDDDPRLLSIFRDIRPLAYLIGPLLGVLVIALLPFKMIFVILAGFLFMGFCIALGMEQTRGWWHKAHRN